MTYQKQNFQDGRVLSASQLNTIEQGIVDNENAIAQKQDKGDYITAETFNAGIANKQDKGDYVTKTEANDVYAPKGDTYTKTEVDEKIAGVGNTQAKLVDLVMLMGQSNMAGRGVVSEAPVVPEGHGYEFRAMSDPTKLYPIIEPFGVNENNSESGVSETYKTGSLVSALAIEYYNRTGIPMVGVSCSKGSTPITFWAKGTKPFEDAMSRHDAAKAWLIDNGYTINHDYMIWLQGEQDGDDGMASATYNGYLKAIIEEAKTHGVEKCFIIRVGARVNNIKSWEKIVTAQTSLCQTYEDAVMVSCLATGFAVSGMLKDNVHFTQSAYNQIGTDTGTHIAYYWDSGLEPYMYDTFDGTLYTPYAPVSSTDIVVDSELDGTSANPVQNKVLAKKVSSIETLLGELEARVVLLEDADAVIYDVTYNLTNVSATSETGKVAEGKQYTNFLYAEKGYEIDSVTIMMGGIDVTADVYNDGNIIIDNVTGAIVITAVGVITPILAKMDFTQHNVAYYVERGLVTIPSGSSPTSEVITEQGLKTNGAYPYGLAFVEPIQVPEKWTLEFVATLTSSGTAKQIKSWGIVGGPVQSPWVVSGEGTPAVFQVRCGKDLNRYSSGSLNIWRYDNTEHTYKIQCIGDYTFNVYVDDELIVDASPYNTADSVAPSRGKWYYILGLSPTYANKSTHYKANDNHFIKRVTLTDDTIVV